jgi:hypothetical protein
MAAKKKSKKQQRKPKTAKNKMRPTRKKLTPKKATSKKGSAKKKSTKKKSTKKRAVVKAKSGAQKMTSAKIAGGLRKPVRRSSQRISTGAFPRERQGARSASQQSGDLQGLSNVAGPDSESVDELLEEGNAFEADVVSGVESAGKEDGREVRTHEVPEDDVPEEYLDKD